jgi:hypothetical protein
MHIQLPHGLRRRSAAACLLRLWVRIPAGACGSICCECCVLSGRGSRDELTPRPEESYRLWYVVVCDLVTSWMRRLWPTGGCRAKRRRMDITTSVLTALPEILSRKSIHQGCNFSHTFVQICTLMTRIRFPCRPDQFRGTPSFLATKWSYSWGKRVEM